MAPASFFEQATASAAIAAAAKPSFLKASPFARPQNGPARYSVLPWAGSGLSCNTAMQAFAWEVARGR
jgi:hypothetical protein